MYRRQELLEKLKEAAASVLPISLIVLAICFVLVPVDTGLMLSFVLATALLILGMGLFTLGAEMSMSKIGNYIGAKLTKSRKLWLILVVSFLLGVAITVAEPDLQVLAANVPEIDKTVLILTVSVGVGIFLMLCMVRILFGISLRLLLIVFYALVFLAAFLSDQGILAVAFDSGGVTTGPMTVPFIMALGVGVASIRSDENAKADSFGLVGLCSIGPIASVLLLGAIYKTQPAQTQSEAAAAITNTVALGRDYRLPGIHEGGHARAAADRGVLPGVPVRLAAAAEAAVSAGDGGHSVHIRGARAVSDGRERRLLAGGLRAGRGTDRGLEDLAAHPAGNAHGLVHHQCGACRPYPQ